MLTTTLPERSVARVAPIPRERAIRLAFLGCGAITQTHSRTLARFGSEVRCFYASRDIRRAERCARRFGGVALGTFSSYAAALGDGRVDAVLVATPPATHLDLTLRALAAGKDVIVEKPAFLRSTDVPVVAAAARAAGHQVLVAENYAYKPITRLLRAVVTSGELGEILFIHVNATKLQRIGGWRADAGLAGGGALFEGGVHWLHLMANLGLRVEAVQGYRPGPLGHPERSMVVVLQYEEGAVGTLVHSWETPTVLHGLRLSKISGTGGAVTFESNGLVALVRGRRTRLLVPGLRDIRGYHAMFRDFLTALRTRSPAAMTLEHARRDLLLVEAAYATAGEGAGEAADA